MNTEGSMTMSRWIDADAMIANALQDSERMYLESVAKHTPSIDIVRCKECKYKDEIVNYCYENDRDVNADDFCSYGEREGE